MSTTNDTKADIARLIAIAGSMDSCERFLCDEAANLKDLGSRATIMDFASSLATDADAVRQMAEAKAQVLGENSGDPETPSQPVGSDFLYAVYDQRKVEDRGRDNIKWYNPFTTVGDRTGSSRNTIKRGVCVHHTGVKGGFGVHSSRTKHWTAQGVDWNPVVDTPAGKATTTWPVPFEANTPEELLQQYARAMALADRYRGFPSQQGNNGVPYHAISGPNSVLYLNLPGNWVTWHGDGANNDFLGYAWDAHSDVDTFSESDILRDLRVMIEVNRDDGHMRDECEFTAHCAWTNKPTDPGKRFLEFLVDKAAPDLGATIRLDFKAMAGAKSIREVLARG